ncbi:DUF1800 family protein [Horticoccus sp. 23ND18S-11]|uniref:DUF1800 family protein n=1 Tax=Horticoccus sp. 23ND18S-11 TaxID=3391832 RepID=UPI0039C9EF96
MKTIKGACLVLFAVCCAFKFAVAAEFDQRVLNISTRAQIGTGANAAVVGFVVGPGGPKSILIRAVGPGLSAFGVGGTLGDPRIDLYDSATPARLVASNDNWATTTVGGATTFGSVGAFGLTTGSRDAALTATLQPGSYTAQVTGVANATGIALVEVYDVTGTARLINLSTRAQVGTGTGILISGLVIAPGGGARKILVRAAGPTLGSFGVAGTLTDPAIAIIDGANNQVASNDNWGTGNVTSLIAAFTQAGAFQFTTGSRDAALLVDLAPGTSYTIQVSGVNNTSGIALVEVYDLTAEGSAAVSVTASTAITDTKGAPPGVLVVSRTGSTASPLTVYYELVGSAVSGTDFAALPNSVTIPAGATSANVVIAALPNTGASSLNKDTTLVVSPGPGYTIGASSAAAVTIFYNPGTLYIASLRTPATATASTAFGTATVQLSADDKFALVNVTFSGLSSPQTVAYLRYGNPGEVGTEIVRLPTGQVNGISWTFAGTGALSAADLVAGLKSGRIFLSIESANYPAGELRGTFVQTSGTLAFTPPPAPPALADSALTAVDAARFLVQSTFGPTKAEIDALAGKRRADLNAWITAQLAVAPSLHLAATDEDWRTYTAVGENPQYSQQNRQAAWWKLALGAPDQLRQRMAFALSQILVVSDTNGTLFNNSRAMANYYDLLVKGAFGNFRQVLEDVTLSPIMGVYLSSLRNGKATFDGRGTLITAADENYAREVMQLFTVGLVQLQPDGTLKLDPAGVPIPTYDNKTITEMAKVFTGFAFASANPTPNFRAEPTNYLQPMMLYPAFHDDSLKTIIGGVTLPANQGGAKDLKDALDTLFNHPNTGPFIVRQLIQRLVTANPSPGYIYRVAQVFANNGSGVRGDLGAVARAILMDYEARSSEVAATASFGKLKEPVLRATAILRAFNGGAHNGRIGFFNPESNLAQAPLRAPTVFNFYEPNFVQPGLLASAGLVAPEYQLVTDTTAISTPNQLWNFIYATRSGMPGTTTTLNPGEGTLGVLLDTSMLALARTPQALVDYVNLVMAAGALPKAVTDRFVTAIAAMPNSTATTYGATDIERVRSAIYLAIAVPQGAIQK